MYVHDYPTCKRTYATLRIYPGDVDPDEVTRKLGIVPTRTQQSLGARVENGVHHAGRPNAWFLSTEGVVASQDVRAHIDWLMDTVMPAEAALRGLQESGVAVDVSCYWLSASGHGGPCLSPSQAEKLARLQLTCWFDVYFLR
jgi:hypothetical protein